MKIFGKNHQVFSTATFRSATRRSFYVLAALLISGIYIGYQAWAHSNGQGIGGATNKNGFASGCSCHCAASNSGTSVSLSTSTTTFVTNHTYSFTVTVSNSGELKAGVEVAVKNGSLTAGTGMQLISGELTHTSAVTLPASWTFSYTTPSTAGWDTLFATGNAVDNDGSNDGGMCNDLWNFAPKFAMQVVDPPSTKAIVISRNSIALGNIRVGGTKKDTLHIRSTSSAAITVASTSMKTGTVFSRYPTTSSRSIASGASEEDSIFFTPTGRGSFSDSLIINSDVDLASDQRKAVYVSGAGIQGVYSGGSTLAFNNVRVNANKLMGFVYSNTGDDTIFFSTPTISGSGFTILTQPTKLALPPGVTDSIVVKFLPTSKTTFSGTLTPSATGFSIPSVSLSGSGVAPTISVNGTTNMGGVRVGAATQGSITIRNTGNDVLNISNVVITGGATARFNIASFDHAIAAGSSGTILLNYSPNAEKTDTIQLAINSDDPNSATNNVQAFAAGFAPHMAPLQKDTIDFGAVKINTAGATRDVTITNNGTDILNISSITVAPLPFSLGPKPSSVDPGTPALFTIKFIPTAVGPFKGSAIVASDDANRPRDTVFCKGSGINSALNVPAEVDFHDVAASSTHDTTFTLGNTGTAPVTIFRYKLTSTDGSFRIKDTSAHTIGAGATVPVSLTFAPSASGNFSGTLDVTVDDASAPTRTISIKGHGVAGALSLSVQTVDFGSVDTLTNNDKVIQVCNTGTGPVVLNTAAITGSAAFTYTSAKPLPITLGPTECVMFTVRFNAPSSKTFVGTLTITPQGLPPLSVSLSGQGNPPKAGVASRTVASGWTVQINPNPSNALSTLSVKLAKRANAEIGIYDVSGRMLEMITSATLEAGSYTFPIKGANLPSGTYFLRVTDSGNLVQEVRMVVRH
jgi:hypothetical protein